MLNVSKDDGLIDAIKEGVKVVVFGYSDDEVLVVDEDTKTRGFRGIPPNFC